MDEDTTGRVSLPDRPDLIRVFVVDDDMNFARGLAVVIDAEPDMSCVGMAHRVNGTVAMIGDSSADVVVIDLHLPDGNGLTLSRNVKDANPDVSVVMLTGDDAPAAVIEAMDHGVDGFALKTTLLEAVLNTVRLSLRGTKIYDAAHL